MEEYWIYKKFIGSPYLVRDSEIKLLVKTYSCPAYPNFEI